MSERLTRKEIKHDIREDEVQSFLLTAVEKVMERPKFYAGLLGAFLGIGVVISAVTAYLDHRADQASFELAEAIRVYGATVDAEKPDPNDPIAPVFASEEERLEAVKEKLGQISSGTPAELAKLYEADIALDNGDSETARQIWQDFLKGRSDHALALSVRLNLLALDRAEGKAEQVADALQSQLDSVEKELPEDVLLFELAQTRDALGQSDEAQELYQRLVDEHPQSPYTAEARRNTAS
ncbi:MAG: tetratricopeptide repeat protein [Thermoanaerobaculia bacterium]|nr:tetratricopeptide repeat protein [Thermoanaerobaculia bacterium]